MNQAKRPYFLWDYNLSEADVRRILAGPNETDRRWLIGRIISAAHFRDVWKYIRLADLVREFPHLKVRSEIKRIWQRALNIWGYAV